ncbi:MAG TPA: hypothetical protein VGM06_07190 [Polyangiaceae bacterium]
MSGEVETHPTPRDDDHVLAVRVGHGANCSSVGSVVDTLFATAAVAAAVFAAVAGALASEPLRTRRSPSPTDAADDPAAPPRGEDDP